MGKSVLFSVFLHTAIIIFSIPAITFCRQINVDKKSFVILPTPGSSPSESGSFSKSDQPFQPAAFLWEANNNGGRTKRAAKTEESVKVRSFKIVSDIRYRYSRTQVTSRVTNPNDVPKEIQFQVLLPDTAFISKFVMEIDNKSYEAYVKEKEEAKNIYNRAQSQGQSAGLVQVNSRSSNIFNVNVNVGGRAKVNFKLTYEELLQRKLGLYEQSISITPNQLLKVDDYQVEVNIEESQNLTMVKVPQLILSNEVDAPPPDGASNEQLNTEANITRLAGNKAQIKWTPSEKDRREIANQKLTGKFLVQYDLHRELDAGQVLVMNGYFVHFFAPTNLAQLRKHVVFVLDISGSMYGKKMKQMKEAMTTILAELQPEDFFNIITFSSGVNHWMPSGNGNGTFRILPISASADNLALAQDYINSIKENGMTNIHDALLSAINVVRGRKLAEALPGGIESLILFLTDGEPTVGETDPTKIQNLVRVANEDESVPIFSLAFGDGADFPFVQKLSLQNQGFGRKIYEAADAALQLKGFYREISSPLLSQVSFNYTTTPGYHVRDVTTHKFPTIFNGTEIIISGFLEKNNDSLIIDIDAVQNETMTFDYDVDEHLASTSNSTQVQNEIDQTLEMAPDQNQNQNEIHKSEPHRHLVVKVGGRGRDAYMHFENPEVRDISIPSRKLCRFCPNPPTTESLPVPTFSTTSTTTEAPSIASQEDSFLEKLWAYLTIKQLIDENTATATANTPKTPKTPLLQNQRNNNESNHQNENSTNVETIETAKEKALRLAIKYGFVTSLTSLVVVKPNETQSVTDTVAAKAESNPTSTSSRSGTAVFQSGPVTGQRGAPSAGSSSSYSPRLRSAILLSAQSMANNPMPPSRSSSALSVPLSHSPIMAKSSIRTRGQVVPFSSDASDDYDVSAQSPDGYADLGATSIGGRRQSHRRNKYGGSRYGGSGSSASGSWTTPSPSTTSRTTLTSNRNELPRLNWLPAGQSYFQLNGTNYKIAVDETSQELNSWRTGESCQLPAASQGGRSTNGTCQHLRDCAKSDIRSDENAYRTSFFCPITSSSPWQRTVYAGVCCNRRPRNRHSARSSFS